MRRLFQLLYNQRALLVFLGLELVSLWNFTRRNQKSTFTYAAIDNIRSWSYRIGRYVQLKEENDQLAKDNTALQNQLLQLKRPGEIRPIPKNTDYKLIPATVINNTIMSTKNYITLDKGKLHGVKPGMGVVSIEGVVGRVVASSKRFSIVIPLLHTSMQVSSQLEDSGALGTVQWTGESPSYAQLLYVPRHIEVRIGETVTTSGYNSTFKKATLMGHVTGVQLKKESPFYDIDLELVNDFSRLQHVYVIKNELKPEKSALEKCVKDKYE